MDWTSSPAAGTAMWAQQIGNREEKEQVARKVAARAKNGDVVGVGSGSTSYLTVVALGERVRNEGLKITAIPTSAELALTCAAYGIPTTTLLAARPDWAFDGADEVDGARRLVKGRGGAMLQEKLVIASSPVTYIVVDRSKRVERLGSKFAVPVEVIPQAVHLACERLTKLGAVELALRMAKGKDGPIVTELGNLVVDARFDLIPDTHERDIAAIPGVVGSGLFVDYPVEIVEPD
jgi:ribose 5-phosphate isomerase A